MNRTKPVFIYSADNHQIHALWSDGKRRVNNYQLDLEVWKASDTAGVYTQLAEPNVFEQVELVNGKFTWNNVLVNVNMDGEYKDYPVDFDTEQALEEATLVS